MLFDKLMLDWAINAFYFWVLYLKTHVDKFSWREARFLNVSNYLSEKNISGSDYIPLYSARRDSVQSTPNIQGSY